MGHHLGLAGAGGGPTEGIVVNNLDPKKHGGDIRVNLIGSSDRPHVSFYLDRARVLCFPSGELLGRLP